MMKLIGQKTFPATDQGYYDAERFADQWSGDNSGYAVVVEDYEHDQIHVMDHADAEGFLMESLSDSWGNQMSQIIYRSDHRSWCSRCMNLITGQVILSRDRTYCSYICLRNK